MYMNLRCPKCGFAFGADIPDDTSKEEIKEIKECPCGAMMEETDRLYAMFDPDDDGVAL